jgi:DNA-directed RNA polymerase alpha subunit
MKLCFQNLQKESLRGKWLELHFTSSVANVAVRKGINYTKAIAYGVNSSMIKVKNFTWHSIKEQAAVARSV